MPSYGMPWSFFLHNRLLQLVNGGCLLRVHMTNHHNVDLSLFITHLAN
uniref:Uncharacterized protein n=1 Tax=Glycine max TaxID=3847 RepID=C6T4E9_SOYBN|nr:unknown [Glycine max]